MNAIFGMQIPRIFADVFSRVITEIDPSEPDYAAILSAMRHSTNIIALEHENFDNIFPPGQVDPLPFACMQGPIITHVLQLGDDRLYEQLASDPNSDPEGLRQSLSIVRVEYKGQEKARLGMVQGGTQVIRRSGHPLTPPNGVPAILSAQALLAAQQATATQQAVTAQLTAQQAMAQQAAAQAAHDAAAAQAAHAASQQQQQQQAAAQLAAQQAAAQQAAAQQAAYDAAQQQQAAAQLAAQQQAAQQAAAVEAAQHQGSNANQNIPGALLAESVRRTARANARGRSPFRV